MRRVDHGPAAVNRGQAASPVRSRPTLDAVGVELVRSVRVLEYVQNTDEDPRATEHIDERTGAKGVRSTDERIVLYGVRRQISAVSKQDAEPPC